MNSIQNKPPNFTQSVLTKEKEAGWLTPQPEKIPQPTYWPIVMALGTIMGLAGIVTAWAVSVVGLALLALGLGGWIGEIRHE
jgi:hypothetical protein